MSHARRRAYRISAGTRCYRRRTSDPAIIAGILDEVAAELGSPIKPRTLQGMTKRISRWMAAHPNMLGTPACELRDIDHGVMTREAEERGQAWAWWNLDRTSKQDLDMLWGVDG